MKKTRGQRRLTLLFTLAMCLILAPAARAAEGGGTKPTISTMLTGYLEPRLTATFELKNAPSGAMVTWSSSDPEVATVHYSSGVVAGVSAGKATITAQYGTGAGDTVSREVTVSGIAVNKDKVPIVVYENGSSASLLSAVTLYGAAVPQSLYFTSRDPYTAEVTGTQVRGLRTGEATIDAVANDGTYSATFTVRVDPDPSTRIPQDVNDKQTLPLKGGETLPFSSLSSYFNSQIGGKVQYITGLFVPTNQGTLYYGYKSEAQPGAGVGQVETYYRSPGAGQRGLSDITFVPKPGFVGGEVTIIYSAVTSDGMTYSCKIVLTVQGTTGGDSSAGGSISLTTEYNTAVNFDSIEFGAVCREKLGSQLDYVIFSQPPERQGALYTNYSSSGSYGSLVDVHSHYSRKQIDDIWFVPAPGYSNGTVTIYYTAFGTNGRSYSGQVTITVAAEDQVAMGGLSYSVAPGGTVRFDDDDFDEYCWNLLNQEQSISGIRFESLPGESEGVLYYDYMSSASTGSPALAGTVYYPGTRAPRIDRLAFVASESFTGTVRLPFTGWTTDGTSFSGTLEINVRGGVASGDIYYYCAPGRSVSFASSDFTSMSRDRTNRTLSYIYFQNLPDSSEGYLYVGSSRVSTWTHYSTSDIGRMTFRASSRFSGLVNMSFVGVSTGGDTFTGVVTIGSGSTGSTSGSSGSGGSRDIRYITDSTTAAVFDRDDFDDLSLWETDRSVSSVRFDVPSSSQGSLYRNYRSGSSMGTRITSSTSIAASDLDRVAFVPASGYTGTVYINFTANASGSGGTFYGTVEVDVGSPAANVRAQYSTRTAPVRFYSGDLTQSGASLSSIRFTSLPSSGAGYLYYQYTSPTQYGQQVNTGTTYQASSISDLTFVPRAGYTGTVTIPYTGTNSSGATFSGEVIITVSPTSSSYYFNDMTNYSGAQLAAVDFLYDHNVTRGMGDGQYGPENPIRRGDFALMLYQAFEFYPVSSGASFTDVSPDAYYATAVNTLYARGIVSGVGGGRYAPDSTLTRQDAICMVQRAMQTIGWNASDGYASALSGYSDGAGVSGYAQGAMALAVQRGYLPIAGGALNPQQPLTRVDMAELLHRALTY